MLDRWTRIWWVRPGADRDFQQVKAGKRRRTRYRSRRRGLSASRAVIRMRRTGSRAIGFSIRPAPASPRRGPAPGRSFRRCGRRTAPARWRWAASVWATRSTPLVYRSRRCTMPGRRSPPTVRKRLEAVQQARSPAYRNDARAGVHHHAGGLVDRYQDASS